VGGVAASIAAMIPGALLLSPSIMVYIAGAITIANAPYSAFKEVRMARIPTIRALNDKLRNEAHRLEAEVDALSEEIDAIAPEAERAGAVEEELREIADRQQFNVDRLIDLVNENEEVLDQMRDNLRQKIVQDIIHIVIKSDVDNDQKFCKVESKMLALKIRIQLQEYGVEFDEMKFYKVMNKCPTVPRVIAIVQKLIPGLGEDDDSAAASDDDEDEDRDNYDMFRLTSDKSLRLTGSLQDVPEGRRASSALMKNSSWRGALGTSVSGSFGGDSRQMSETKQVTLALASCTARRRNKKRNSLIR
jgi:outer membrane murein-binding lipoprotein Lpp